MKLTLRYMKTYARSIACVIAMKLVSTICELLLPYILEHLIDEIVPRQAMGQIFLWGALMVLCALAAFRINVYANAKAIDNSDRKSVV